MAIFPSTIDDRTTAIENPASQPNAFTLSIGMASKRGPRDKNEDAAGVSPCHTFFAIADGIGGAPLGDIMSTAACNAAADAFLLQGIAELTAHGAGRAQQYHNIFRGNGP